MRRFMVDVPSLLPYLDADDGTAGGGEGAGNTGGTEGTQGGGDKPFATFPDEKSFTARVKREAQSIFGDLAKELGFDSPDALKEAAKTAKSAAEAQKTETQKLQDQLIAAESAKTQALTTANQRLITAEAKVQAAGLGIKAERVNHALKLADLSAVTIGDDGEADSAAITTALEAVLADLPELKGSTTTSVGGGSNPPATGDTATRIQQLEKDLEEAGKRGDRVARIRLQTELQNLRKQR